MTHTHEFTAKTVRGFTGYASTERYFGSPTCECGLSKAMHDYLKAKEEANEHCSTS